MKKILLALLLTSLLSSAVNAGDSAEVTTEVLAKTGISWDGSPLPAYPDKDGGSGYCTSF